LIHHKRAQDVQRRECYVLGTPNKSEEEGRNATKKGTRVLAEGQRDSQTRWWWATKENADGVRSAKGDGGRRIMVPVWA
jgi:hypothetical protein